MIHEIRTARQISHPNVCRVYDIEEVAGQTFLSMEYIEGETLASLLKRVGRLSQAKAIELGSQICHGLSAIHQSGFLHRDLKPSNLMIDQQGKARLTDLGLAVWIGSVHGRHIRQGTPAYMSPEQQEGREVSVASDLYALGLVLYELFTGHKPFSAETPEQWAHLHCQAPPTQPSEVFAELAPSVEQAILWCLAKDSRQRPESALAVAAALARAQTTMGSSRVKTLLAARSAGGDGSVLSTELDDLSDQYGGQKSATTEGTVWLFDRPIQAVQCSLGLLQRLQKKSHAKLGIHLGEVNVDEPALSVESGGCPYGIPEESCRIVSRLSAVAEDDQILLTRGAFDVARQSGLVSEKIFWLAHGSYEISGLNDALDLFEVGLEAKAPLRGPWTSPLLHKQLEQKTIAGWRPAPGLEMPQRPHWMIEEKLGQGGFGEVWLARHRKTGARRVFKLCYDPVRLHSLKRETTLFRFLKQTLGHRSDIARLLDWNFEQPPYFLEAEYTSGGSLIEWAEERGGLEQAPLAARLEIVAQIATALAAAHSVGVLHKDVKPGNILIQPDGDQIRAQLSDFGVSMLTEEHRLAEIGITMLGWTEASGTTLTPWDGGTLLYRAPESLEGKPPSLQADIYALGVVLYQMAVADTSRALAPGWEQDLEDELLIEDIAAAVAGPPERRLSDAQQLAERLRSLETRREDRERQRCEQEQARAAVKSLMRARKRRKVIIATMLFLFLFATLMWNQSRRAQREAEAARQVSSFLENLYKGLDLDQARGSELTVRELLDRGAERIDRELAGQPWIQAKLYHTIGTVYHSLKLQEPAVSVLEKALEIRRRIHQEPHPEIAESLHTLGDVVHDLPDVARAEALLRDALAMRRRLLPGDHLDIAETLDVMAHVQYHKGKPTEAETFARDALGMRRKHLGMDHALVAESIDLLAYIVHAQSQDLEAERLFQQALEIKRKILDPEHSQIAESLHHLAYMMRMRGNYLEAEPLFREALARQRKLLGPGHPELGSYLRNLALTLIGVGHYEAAEAPLLEALDRYRGLEHNEAYSALILTDLGSLYTKTRNFSRAETVLQEAVKIHQKAQEKRPNIAYSLDKLGFLRQAQDQFDEAEVWFMQALEQRRALLGDEHPEVALSFLNLGRLKTEQGTFDEAEKLLQKALNSQQTSPKEHKTIIFEALSDLAKLQQEKGSYDKAQEYFLRAIREREQYRGRDNIYFAFELNKLARLLLLKEEFKEAESTSLEGLAIARNLLPLSSWRIHDLELTLGIAWIRLGLYKEAAEILTRCFESLRENLSLEAPKTQESLEYLIAVHEALDNRAEAARLRASI